MARLLDPKPMTATQSRERARQRTIAAILNGEPAKPARKRPARKRPASGPATVRKTLSTIAARPAMRRSMLAMRDRQAEFSTPMAAALAGVALDPNAVRYLNDQLDAMWRQHAAMKITAADELVIGAGLHAAIYCAVRVATGHPAPLVIEASDRVGGAFAASREAAFYLNSRNRPGTLGYPGRPGALNVIPGAVVQPADLNGDEYQRNTDLALAIRATLAMNARVLTGRRALSIVAGRSRRNRVELEGGGHIEADRVLVATGLGTPKRLCPRHDRVLTFDEFVARMDEPFPMRGMSRVAVVGAGDSGKTAIEALVGQGPTTRWSVASLDWIETIDWYGVPADRATRQTWEDCTRSRYKGLGRLLPKVAGGPARVQALTERAPAVAGGHECGFVNERPYDLVVACVGYEPARLAGVVEGLEPLVINGRASGRVRAGGVYDIGPAAQLALSDQETGFNPAVAAISENATALFRYAGRTAAVAAAAGRPKQNIDAAAPAPTVALGVDRDGNEIYVGTQVKLVDYDKTGPVLGIVSGGSGLYAVDVPGGGYDIDGRVAYGAGAAEVVVVG